MAQFADISEFRKNGNDMLNTEEFRERLLDEYVGLLDFEPNKRVKGFFFPKIVL